MQLKIRLHTMDGATKDLVINEDFPPKYWRTEIYQNLFNGNTIPPTEMITFNTRVYEYFDRTEDLNKAPIPHLLSGWEDPLYNRENYIYHYRELWTEETKKIEEKELQIKKMERKFDLEN